MNILIMGCSYGVPNYFGLPGVDPEFHTEFLLQSKGHCVHNCSKNAGSNMDTLNRAKKYLNNEIISHPGLINTYIQKNNNESMDLIIWFHTELSRDNAYSPEQVYSEYAKFFKTQNAKLAIIGGAGDIDPLLYSYILPDFCIPSWRSVILNSISSSPVNGYVYIERSSVSKIDKISMIEDNLLLIEKMGQSEDFPDGCHPGIKPHAELVELLCDKFNL